MIFGEYVPVPIPSDMQQTDVKNFHFRPKAGGSKFVHVPSKVILAHFLIFGCLLPFEDVGQ